MTVSAPYNFVPLSDRVCKAADLGLTVPPSQDTPVPDGLSGVIEMTLTSPGPLLVNWGVERVPGVKTTGRVPGDAPTDPEVPAIPGSTLRGMTRNVLEIAGFGKMILADDTRVGVRDLTQTGRLDYGSKVAISPAPKVYAPLSHAGWMRMVNGELRIIPCAFARIEHVDLSTFSTDFKTNIYKHPNRAQAQTVQTEFTGDPPVNALSRDLLVEDIVSDHQHKGKWLRYRKAQPIPAGPLPVGYSRKSGTLVFTGMPNDDKHMEFFFFDPVKNAHFLVPDKVWRAFLDVHEEQEHPSPTWEWRRADLVAGRPIPVFYLTANRQPNGPITHLGLAMMFKIAADNSFGQMIDNTSPDHRSPDVVDLAEAIFGRLESAPGKGDGWRGRVSFGWALAQAGTWSEPADQDVSVILAKPKPSFAPAYVRQRDFGSVAGDELLTLGVKITEKNGVQKETTIKANYRSYMNWGTDPKNPVPEQIRGWKRYPVGPERNVPDQANPPTGATVSRLRPLRPSGAGPIIFTFRLRYHNLHKVELGAVLWALTWGGDDRLRHALGMGRPLGWGQTRIAATLTAEQRAALGDFTQAMEGWANRQRIPGGWAGSIQLRQLRAMADPAVGQQMETLLKQMVLNPDRKINQFQDAKTKGAVLPEYGLSNIADTAGNIEPAKVKTERELTEDVRNRIAKVNHGFGMTRTQPAPIRYAANEGVEIRSGALNAQGLVMRPTGDDGQTLVAFYRTPADARASRVSQEFFGPNALSPLVPAP